VCGLAASAGELDVVQLHDVHHGLVDHVDHNAAVEHHDDRRLDDDHDRSGDTRPGHDDHHRTAGDNDDDNRSRDARSGHDDHHRTTGDNDDDGRGDPRSGHDHDDRAAHDYDQRPAGGGSPDVRVDLAGHRRAGHAELHRLTLRCGSARV
jgi:hypothetical protein